VFIVGLMVVSGLAELLIHSGLRTSVNQIERYQPVQAIVANDVVTVPTGVNA
jgi:hypothetical protein